MDGGGRLDDLPHVVLLEIFCSVSFELGILVAREIFRVGIRWQTSLVWHLDSIKLGECAHQGLSRQLGLVQVVSGDAGKCCRAKLDQSAGVVASDDLDPLNITVE